MDSDDISFLDRFEKQVKFLEENKDIWIVWWNAIFINENWDKIWEKNYPENNKELKELIFFRCPFLHPSVIFRKECFESLGWYDNNFVYAEDFELWIRYWVKYKFHNIQNNLLKYRISWDNSTINHQKEMINKTLKVRRKAIKLGYKITLKWKIYFVWTWIMQFLPPKFVLWLFNKINKYD